MLILQFVAYCCNVIIRNSFQLHLYLKGVSDCFEVSLLSIALRDAIRSSVVDYDRNFTFLCFQICSVVIF